MSDHILRQAERDYSLGDIDVTRLNIVRIRHGIEPMITAEELGRLVLVRHFCEIGGACQWSKTGVSYADYQSPDHLTFDWVSLPGQDTLEYGMLVGEMRNDWVPEEMEMRLESLRAHSQTDADRIVFAPGWTQ